MNEITATALLELATDLTASLTTKTRYDRLLDTVRKTIPCEAVALLLLKADHLKPIAIQGLSRDTLGRRFLLSQHPRFAQICHAQHAIRFPSDCSLADPYDGLLIDREGDLPVHSCMGLPLYFENKLLGVLTLDSLAAHVFEHIPKHTLDIVCALAAATLNTALMIERLETHAKHSQQMVSRLSQAALHRDNAEIIGHSKSIQQMEQYIDIAAPSDFTILIQGETGVGKELVARKLHQQSKRSKAPLVYVNCAALAENLIESELFGHVKGAFTGAQQKRAGKFVLADNGTLFLDEIGELPLTAQSKLLRVLQSNEVQPVGQDNIEQVNVRVIAATNRNLADEVTKGNFRADLYHRLTVFPINIPSLREREGDIPLLCGFFTEHLRRKLGLAQLKISSSLLTAFEYYHWPGNVRELEHMISRSALKAKSRSATNTMVVINFEDCTELAQPNEAKTINNNSDRPVSSKVDTLQQLSAPSNNLAALGLREATDQFQQQLLLKAIEQHAGNWSQAARTLNLDRANFSRLAKRLGISQHKTTTLTQ
jgi:anaerobic nitric oxide reductase transcription regulator